MNIDDYKTLQQKNAYDALWFELLNASGFAGILPNGNIVDRRYYPNALPVSENKLMGIAKPISDEQLKKISKVWM